MLVTSAFPECYGEHWDSIVTLQKRCRNVYCLLEMFWLCLESLCRFSFFLLLFQTGLCVSHVLTKPAPWMSPRSPSSACWFCLSPRRHIHDTQVKNNKKQQWTNYIHLRTGRNTHETFLGFLASLLLLAKLSWEINIGVVIFTWNAQCQGQEGWIYFYFYFFWVMQNHGFSTPIERGNLVSFFS